MTKEYITCLIQVYSRQEGLFSICKRKAESRQVPRSLTTLSFVLCSPRLYFQSSLLFFDLTPISSISCGSPSLQHGGAVKIVRIVARKAGDVSPSRTYLWHWWGLRASYSERSLPKLLQHVSSLSQLERCRWCAVDFAAHLEATPLSDVVAFLQTLSFSSALWWCLLFLAFPIRDDSVSARQSTDSHHARRASRAHAQPPCSSSLPCQYSLSLLIKAA